MHRPLDLEPLGGLRGQSYQSCAICPAGGHAWNKQSYADILTHLVAVTSFFIDLCVLPNEIVSVQILRFYPRADIQCCSGREDSISHNLGLTGVVVWYGDCPKEVVDDLEKIRLLEPGLTCCGTSAK